MDPQQQEQAAFESSLAGTELEAPAPTGTPDDGAPAGVEQPANETEPAAQEPEPGNQKSVEPDAEPEAEAAPKDPEAPAPDEDPVILDGLKRSELHRLLSNAADVEGLKRQLDKAHGNIGDLKRQLQQSMQAVQQASAAGATAPELAEKIKQFEQDYPDVAEYMRAMGFQKQQPSQEAAATQEQQPASAAPTPEAQAVLTPFAIELAVMDHVHKGWREKVNSQEFRLWLASQGDEVRRDYDTAQTAEVMAGVIGKYDQWAVARQAATDRAAKGQQRLSKALTPNGNAPRPQAAITEQQAFEAALKE